MKLIEVAKIKAIHHSDLVNSIKDGVFRKDGTHLEDPHNLYADLQNLKSLVGSPRKISRHFLCNNNKLQDLIGGPEEVGGDFNCQANMLKSLVGAPKVVKLIFDCRFNSIRSLEGIPEILGTFNCTHNSLRSLQDIHKMVKQMNGAFKVNYNPIKSHVLGLVKIPGCKWVEMDGAQEVEDIMNKYLPLGDIFDCQEELIEAGFEEYAQL